QSMITKRVAADVQGRIQGALSSLIALAGIIGPAMYGGSFAYFISEDAPVTLPGIPFAIAAVILAIAFATAWRIGTREVALDAAPALAQVDESPSRASCSRIASNPRRRRPTASMMSGHSRRPSSRDRRSTG